MITREQSTASPSSKGVLPTPQNDRDSFVCVDQIINATEVGIVVIDSKQQVVFWNTWIESMSNISQADALHRTLTELFPTQISPRLVNAVDNAISSRFATLISPALNQSPVPIFSSQENRLLNRPIPQMITVKPLNGVRGETLCLVQIIDLSQTTKRERVLRKQAREMQQLATQAKEREVFLRTLIDSTIDGVITVDCKGFISTFNPAACEIFHYLTPDIIGQPFDLLVSPTSESIAASDSSTNSILNRLASNTCLEVEARKRDGTRFPVELSVGNMEIDHRPVYIVNVKDITERKKAEAQIQHIAHHDPLTSLPNRALFQDRLDQAIALAQRNNTLVAVMFLDLDRFKGVNDTLGHHTGDALLKSVSQCLLECTRASDTVARLGGDEFAIIQPDISNIEGAVKLAQKVVRATASAFSIDDQSIQTSTSVGITLFPSDGTDHQQLLKNADTAMYMAKKKGRNTFQFFSREMHEEAQNKLKLEQDLRSALENSELFLQYQPKVVLETGRVGGLEALVRWQHPQRGLVSPGEFIPLSEESGLIVPLGEWVLEHACRETQGYIDRGHKNLRVAVNISPVQFQSGGLVESISRILHNTGLSPHHLEIEITENMLMEDVAETTQRLHDLSDLGIELSIDDFGTGYSSLGYLKRFPVNTIKIDHSFIKDLVTDKDSAAIVQSIINLGDNLGLNVIAEGVETREQLQLLRQLGCHEIQGFIFSRPLPAADVERAIARIDNCDVIEPNATTHRWRMLGEA